MPRGVQDRQSVWADGSSVRPLIDGIQFFPTVLHIDDRGGLCEVPKELFCQPVVDAHQVTIRPGMIKGWIVHYLQEDRLFFWQGDFKIVLFDDRSASATYRAINELYLGACRPGLLIIPCGIFHAVQNLGSTDTSHMSFPTVPYNHECPDKYRLPVDAPDIPYLFNRTGW